MRISDWSSDVCSSDLRHRAGGDVIRPDLLDRLFLLLVGEMERAAGQRVGVGHAAHDTLWALVERARLAVRPRPAQVAERCTAQFDAVEPRALGQRQIILLAAFDIDIPVRSEEHTSELQSLMRIS